MTPDRKMDELADEQFCEALLGRAEDADTEADALKDALNNYRAETLLWAKRRSAAMPSLAEAARRRSMWAVVPQWTLAAVAVMTVAVGVAHFHAAPAETADAGTVIQRSVGTTTQQMADDNALLNSIDAAVNAGSGLPVSALGLDSPHTVGPLRGSME